MVGEDQAKATIRNLLGRHVQKESMHSDVWSVVMWPSRAAFLQVWAADDIRELWKVVVSYLSDGVQSF